MILVVAIKTITIKEMTTSLALLPQCPVITWRRHLADFVGKHIITVTAQGGPPCSTLTGVWAGAPGGLSVGF